jgi:hypothetical protein
MNIPVSVTRPEEVPSCFGREWNKNEPECAGGPDQGFTHPKSGLHVREPCNFFQSCGVRTQALRQAQSAVVPPQQLLRPPQQTPQTFADFMRLKNAEYAEQQRVQAMGGVRPPTPVVQPQQQVQQQVHVMGAPHHPAPVYQLNYMMPGYLSMPEERLPGEGLFPVLLREVIRSMLKALGHSVSHFFDARSFKEK